MVVPFVITGLVPVIQSLLSINPFTMRPAPIIPVKAGIRINASWIPAFAGMVGLWRSGDNGTGR